MQVDYRPTLRACFIGYVVQAVVNNFIPLLFVTLQAQYQIPLAQITALITVNFVLQLGVDFSAVFFVDRIGYRAAALLAHGFSALGLAGLTVLPEICPSPFGGLLAAVACYAIGGGLLEVIISPMVEACPGEHKDRTMSLLHAFYCWGCVGVVGLSTLFFQIAGIGHWKTLALLWALVPFLNGWAFARVPIAPLLPEGEKGVSFGGLFRSRLFWLFVVIMVCAGASEQAVSQWASALAEQGLGIPKAVGDLAGPALFAVLMGLSRTLYGKLGGRIPLEKMMLASSCLCVVAYLIAALAASPGMGLAGVALCGFSVGILWPGTFSRASAAIRGGGTALFALLALAGDLGCASGPTFAGLAASLAGNRLQTGILAAVIFPLTLAVILGIWRARRPTRALR